jgi:hypothetical protein
MDRSINIVINSLADETVDFLTLSSQYVGYLYKTREKTQPAESTTLRRRIYLYDFGLF